MKNSLRVWLKSQSCFLGKAFIQFVCVCVFSLITLGPSTPANADTLYASSAAGGPGQLYILDAATGAMVQDIGPLNDSGGTNYPITGLAFHPITGVLYGSTGNNPATTAARLVTINPDSGLVTVVGSFNAGPVGGNGNPSTMADIAFDNAGNLYGVGSIGGPQLYSINIITGQATVIGTTGLTSTTGGGLAISSGGVFYGTPTASRYGTYDSTTGAFTAITLAMVKPAGGGYGALAFNEIGVLYGLNVGSGTPPPSHLVTIDQLTGTITDLGQSVGQLDAIAFRPIFPILAIAKTNSQVALNWPDLSGFSLEYKTNLSSGGWLTNTAPTTTNNGNVFLTLPIDSAAKFFRLRMP